ncbi:MAG: sigma-70 family RNA polymerase sigma factor [Verrucomicrobiales bacterium]|nr:sigma-70 family RNA polymerase sigma factor [Verrucomicrobiales bacterium]
MSETDIELLARYKRERAEDAFEELVRRHLGLIYSAALREVHSPQLAEEVSQSVFTDLARDAARLKPDTVLAAWLYRVARRTAIDVIRREASRQLREQVATELNAMKATAADWKHVEPLLDEAMDALDDTDRAAVLLRYFENKSLREVGDALGASENAAQKRLTRAVERLRDFFAKRGLTVGASGLVVVISSNAAQAAPAGLAITISSAALLVSKSATATAVATKAIVMTTLQKTVIGLALAAAVGTGIYEARQVSRLRGEMQTLQRQHAVILEENDRLTQAREDTASRLAMIAERIGKKEAFPAELLKLRGEVSRLGAELRESPMARITSLKRKLDEMPDKRIPEMQFLTEKEWAIAAWDADLTSADGARRALGPLREKAIGHFLFKGIEPAVKKYLAANGGVLPPDLLQLKPYFDVPVTDEMLQRYQLLQTGKPDPNAELIKLSTHVDQEYDSQMTMSLNGGQGGDYNMANDTVKNATVEFAKANHGRTPSDASQLAAYLKQPIEAELVQKYFQKYLDDVAAGQQRLPMVLMRKTTEANGGKTPENP